VLQTQFIESKMTINIPKIILSNEDMFLNIFKDIHENPELGFEENRTSKIVQDKLTEFGVDEVHSRIGVTGVVGVIEGRKKSLRSIGIRADMDALPIQEKTNLPYSSKVKGKMHACGHDAHTTMLLGAAKYLSETRNFDGKAILIFQPAEEGLGGATKMIREGVLKKFPCDEIYGMHNWPNQKPNKVEICIGPAMAGAAFFDIQIVGKGSHAAAPQNSKDALLIASTLITQIQHIISRNIPPLETCVISVTQIHSGSAYNVIPETAEISGTIRYFSNEIFMLAKTRLEKICNGLEISHDIKINIKIRKVFDVLVNDEGLSKAYIDAASDIVGSENTNIEAAPSTGSEDFADFLKLVPGAYCKLGHGGNVALHSPEFYLDPKSLSIGSAILSRIIEKRMPIT
jgi:hippurate hydrolase